MRCGDDDDDDDPHLEEPWSADVDEGGQLVAMETGVVVTKVEEERVEMVERGEGGEVVGGMLDRVNISKTRQHAMPQGHCQGRSPRVMRVVFVVVGVGVRVGLFQNNVTVARRRF